MNEQHQRDLIVVAKFYISRERWVLLFEAVFVSMIM